MKGMLPLVLAAGLVFAGGGAGHAGESPATAGTAQRYVLNVDGMT
jgi:hypothetical protein